jgi:hypothetical protein
MFGFPFSGSFLGENYEDRFARSSLIPERMEMGIIAEVRRAL